jgi:hypothetical protein
MQNAKCKMQIQTMADRGRPVALPAFGILGLADFAFCLLHFAF